MFDYQLKFQRMREVGALTTRCLNLLDQFIEPGITTEDINFLVQEFQTENELENPQFGYKFSDSKHSFPAYCCTSVNERLCHEIPSEDVKLKEGDIVSVDITFKKNGYLGDACRTYAVGKISKEAENLIHVAQNALQVGLQQCAPYALIRNIGRYIEEYVNHNKMWVVGNFTGHGISTNFHEGPTIPHVFSEDFQFKLPMHSGMTFTIEPIITLKKTRHRVLNDNWTVKGKQLAAQFEATIGINETGYEVFCR